MGLEASHRSASPSSRDALARQRYIQQSSITVALSFSLRALARRETCRAAKRKHDKSPAAEASGGQLKSPRRRPPPPPPAVTDLTRCGSDVATASMSALLAALRGLTTAPAICCSRLPSILLVWSVQPAIERHVLEPPRKGDTSTEQPERTSLPSSRCAGEPRRPLSRALSVISHFPIAPSKTGTALHFPACWAMRTCASLDFSLPAAAIG